MIFFFFKMTIYIKSYNKRFLSIIKGDNFSEFNIDFLKKDNKPQIVLKNVNTTYEGERYPTLYDINLEINQGEFIFIIGPNGSGKTTLLETILGILPLEKGIAEIDGKSVIRNGSKIRKKIGYIIQGLEFDPQTPFLVKNTAMVARSGRKGLLKRNKKGDKAIAKLCLDVLRNKQETEDYWDRPIGKLSGGMQQKVMFANALAAEPDILLLDEPFANLDINSRDNIFKLLAKLNRVAKTTIICVSHEAMIPKEVTRLIMIQKGRIILDEKRDLAVNSETFRAYTNFMANY